MGYRQRASRQQGRPTQLLDFRQMQTLLSRGIEMMGHTFIFPVLRIFWEENFSKWIIITVLVFFGVFFCTYRYICTRLYELFFERLLFIPGIWTQFYDNCTHVN